MHRSISMQAVRYEHIASASAWPLANNQPHATRLAGASGGDYGRESVVNQAQGAHRIRPARSVGSILAGLLAFFAVALAAHLVQAQQVQLDVALAHPTMLCEDQSVLENHLRIKLTGFELPGDEQRMPINVALVIDRSGSMQGDKLARARDAAIQAVRRLTDTDIVSVITYESTAQVVVPATKATNRDAIIEQIHSISPGGSTALHAGVSQGADEVRKFMDDQHVNRVILLSDGLANVGPKSPAELERLGEQLLEQGISVTTMGLGLGYNEDLMSRLALASSGNHVFIEDAESLVDVFQHEFDDVMSVVAQRLKIQATLAEGIRPVKVLNQNAEIDGQEVYIDLGQLYSRQERYFVLEIEIPQGEPGSSRRVADVKLEYFNMLTETNDKLTSSIETRFTDSPELAEKSVDKDVLAECVIQIANERNRQATELRDQGEVDQARSLLESNADYLNSYYSKLGLESLGRRATMNSEQAGGLDDRQWSANRKSMREAQAADASQQSYTGKGKRPEDVPDSRK